MNDASVRAAATGLAMIGTAAGVVVGRFAEAGLRLPNFARRASCCSLRSLDGAQATLAMADGGAAGDAPGGGGGGGIADRTAATTGAGGATGGAACADVLGLRLLNLASLASC